MRKLIEIIAGHNLQLSEFGINENTHCINRIWTVYDEDRMWNWCKFDHKTGEKIAPPETLEDVQLRHREGVFIEDRVHDWNIRKGNQLDFYSRVVRQGQTVKILIEYEEK